MERTHYVIRGGLEGRERLRILARVMRPTTRGLLERVGVGRGMACLDVGCGGGDVSFEIARLVAPGGRIVGIDLDGTKIELARTEAAALELPAVEFRVSEVEQIGGDLQFDFAYARFLLTHLSDPASVLTRMHGLLRPGGMIVVEDIDFSGHFCHPDSAAFRRYVDLYTEVVRKRGADADIGPKLPGLLLDAGYRDVEMNVVQPAGLEGEAKLIAAITMENIADSVVTEGLTSRAEVDDVIAELYRLAEDRRTVMSLPRVVQVWGNRDATLA